MLPKRLVLFVAGRGDLVAAPVLVKRLITEYSAWDALFLDPHPFHTGDVCNLVTPKAIAKANWERWLSAALKRGDLSAVLLLVDADLDEVSKGVPFCRGQCALDLSRRARTVGAGALFSVGSVLACKEYESWLIAGAASLAGRELPDGRPGVAPETVPPAGDLEVAPRDAKGWLSKHMSSGYKPTVHQAALTQMVDITLIRQRRMRSFQRLETSLKALVEAVRTGRHIVAP